MKDGYYWARLNPKKFGEFDWEIVEVSNPWDEEQKVQLIGDELYHDLEDFEFGDRIEMPEKYK